MVVFLLVSLEILKSPNKGTNKPQSSAPLDIRLTDFLLATVMNFLEPLVVTDVGVR